MSDDELIIPGGVAAWYRKDGSRRTEQELLKLVGHLGVRIAKLDEAMRERLGQPRLDYPPKVFISYKHGDPEDRRFVERLARVIEQRGFGVALDVFRDESVDRSVEDFVSRMVECAIFVAVITDTYREGVSSSHVTWVFDELQSALLAQEQGRMEIVSILRQGSDALPYPGLRQNVIDLRSDADLDAALGERFRWSGPVLDQEARRSIENALAISERTGSFDASLVERFPFVHALWLARVRSAVAAGRLPEALEAARRGSKESVSRAGARELRAWESKLWREVDRDDRALAVGVGLLKERVDDHADLEAHRTVGNILDDQGDLLAGRNHMNIPARRLDDPLPANDLGFILRRLGSYDRALELFDRILARDPDHELAARNKLDTLRQAGRIEEAIQWCRALLERSPGDPVLDRALALLSSEGSTAAEARRPPLAAILEGFPLPWFGCQRCEAVYVRGVRICGDCAAMYQEAATCPHCGNDGTVPVEILASPIGVNVMCPTCRRAGLKAIDTVQI